MNLIGMEPDQVTELMEAWGYPAYRGRQILQWIYKKGVFDFSEMSNLPVALRERLIDQVSLELPTVLTEQVAQDGTTKILFALRDKETVEVVLIPEGERRTACISSQVGCAVGCSFCATGQAGFTRNLSSGEILGQMLAMSNHLKTDLTNVVFMGMGEPFSNYDHVMAAVRIMNDSEGLGFGARRITISTSGVVPGILRLAEEPLQVNLAISLHATTDELRDKLVPMNRAYPIAKLLDACRHYIAETNRRVTFEYVLLEDVNDAEDDATRLGKLLAGMLCHVNVIPVNPVSAAGYARPKERETSHFARIVTRYGVETTIRQEKGTDIDAACGQLRQRQAGEAQHQNPN